MPYLEGILEYVCNLIPFLINSWGKRRRKKNASTIFLFLWLMLVERSLINFYRKLAADTLVTKVHLVL